MRPGVALAPAHVCAQCVSQHRTSSIVFACFPALVFPCRSYQVLEDTAEGRQALGLDAAFTGPSDMYMPLAEPGTEEPESPLSQHAQQAQQVQLQDNQLLLPAGRNQHQRLPLPSGLGIGLTRHVHERSRQGWSARPQLQQQQGETALEMLEDVVMGDESSAAADMHASSSAGAATAVGGAGGLQCDADEAAAMAVDSAEGAAGGMFADAVQIGAADLACEGLGDLGFGGAGAAGGGGFIQLQGVEQLGGAFEAVRLPRVGGAAGTGDGEDMQAAGHGLMQLHFNGS